MICDHCTEKSATTRQEYKLGSRVVTRRCDWCAHLLRQWAAYRVRLLHDERIGGDE